MLRGLAALAVACYHLTNMGYLSGTWLQQAGSYGWLGVESFFVISGFVIPYSLLAARYDQSQFGRFLLRRIVRIDPPYLASIALCMGLGYAAYAFGVGNAHEPDYSIGQVAAHLGYANNFLGYRQINRVFWTLGIEFQFYILIGLAHAVIMRGRWTVIGPTLVAGIVLDRWVRTTHINPEHVIAHWVPLFLMGIAVAAFRWELISRNRLLAQLGVYAAAAVIELSWPVAAVALGSALLIAFMPMLSAAPLDWLGRISYSLYLVHSPVGERLMNLTHRFDPPAVVSLAIAMGLTLLFAWGFNVAIEEPARRWARRVGQGASPAPVPSAA